MQATGKLDALLGYSEAAACRRQVLLRYFGEDAGPCGNCDMCLTPPETWEAGVAAQQALSTIFRSGQRYGAGHLIDILHGRSTPKVKEREHTELSTFGIGKDVSDTQWSTLLRQMVAQGLVGVNEHGGFYLLDTCRSVLRGEQGFTARKVRESAPSGSTSVRKEMEFESDEARALWAALRQCRRKLSEEQNVPAYMIFGDATLKQMLEKRPDSPETMYE